MIDKFSYLFYADYHPQFLLFRGILGCWDSLFFIARRTEIGIGSIVDFITSGPMMLLGLYDPGFSILFIEVDLIGSRQLLMLFCLSLSPLTLSFLL